MNLDEYMQVLQRRCDEHMATHRIKPRFPPLLEWFIRDEDAEMVELPEPPKPEPKPAPRPRYYRPASYWRERVASLQSRMQALSEPLLPDRAAAGGCGLGPKRTARIQAREDSRLQKYVALNKQLTHANRMLRAAEAREAKTEEDAQK